MKVLISILAKKDNRIYSNLENTIRNTWLKIKPNNIDVIFYYGDSKKNILERDRLFLTIPDVYSNISYKTLLMYDYVYKNMNNYDYIFRTNLSSYVDLKQLINFLENKPKTKFYCGIKGKYNNIEFASGSGYFISKDILNLIIKNKKDWDKTLIDDVALGKLLSKLNININESAQRKDMLTVNDIIKPSYHYRCKQKNRKDDIIILNKIYNYKTKIYKMQEIIDIYKTKIKTRSDINEHLETIYNISLECDHITEMGVRDCVSTWAMLASEPNKMISYDIIKHKNVDQVEQLTKKYNINFTFYTKDTLNCEIEETDLLLIDTLHTYNQLYNELKLHANKVKKYIILHDTVSFGYKDEFIYNHASNLIKNKPKIKQGLVNAMNDFLKENLKWKIFKTYNNNNGLTILINEDINLHH